MQFALAATEVFIVMTATTAMTSVPRTVLALWQPLQETQIQSLFGLSFLISLLCDFYVSTFFRIFSLFPQVRDVGVLSLVLSAGCIFINYLQTIGALSTSLVPGGFTFVWWPDKTVDLMANKKIIRFCAFIFIVISTSYSDENCKLTFYYVLFFINSTSFFLCSSTHFLLPLTPRKSFSSYFLHFNSLFLILSLSLSSLRWSFFFWQDINESECWTFVCQRERENFKTRWRFIYHIDNSTDNNTVLYRLPSLILTLYI